MKQTGVGQSVVTKLVAAVILGGLALSFCLGMLEYRRSARLLQIELTQQAVAHARNMQTVLREAVEHRAVRDLGQSIQRFATHEWVRAVRLSGRELDPIEVGDWGLVDEEQPVIWRLEEHAQARDRVSLDRRTLVQARFRKAGRPMTLELLVDGPQAVGMMRSRMLVGLSMQWLLLAIMTLVGLLLLRRWFASPLAEVIERVANNAQAESFEQLSGSLTGEFAQLSESIGGMLSRLRNTADQLRVRERAFEHLYQSAPAALVSVDEAGRVCEANRRAADLFRLSDESQLVGQDVLTFVATRDHGKVRHTIERLEVDRTARCEIVLRHGEELIDVLLEASPELDDLGALQTVRLSLLDITEQKQLQKRLGEQTRLLKLLIDHMSDAILLTDGHARVIAHNQHLADLLHLSSDALTGAPYEPSLFWDALGPIDHAGFAERLRQIEAETERPAQHRVETRVGVFLFIGIPVHDEKGERVGRLWVVRDITAVEQSRRLLEQQAKQLNAFRRLAGELTDVTSTDALLEMAARLCHEAMGVEALGIALRGDRSGRRSRQMLHRGADHESLATGRALIDVVEAQLMPEVLNRGELTQWDDLDRKGQAWAQPFLKAGYTALCAVPIRGRSDAQGVLWIARRGGERFGRSSLYLLESLAPVIAARVELTQTMDRLADLALTDHLTGLPNRRHLLLAAEQLERRAEPWALVLLRIDRFDQHTEGLSDSQREAWLSRLGAQLGGSLRKSNTLARVAGATFAALCPACDAQAAVAIATRLQQLIREVGDAEQDESGAPRQHGDPYETPNAEAPSEPACADPWTASVGIAAAPVDGNIPDALIELAESRLEMARRAGPEGLVAPTITAEAG